MASAYSPLAAMEPKTLLLVLYLIVGTLFIGLSIPLIRGRIAPNSWYGFRVKRTLENPAVWYPVNRFAASHLFGLGIAMMTVAIVLYALPQISFVRYALACLVVTLIGLGVLVLRSFQRLHRI
jgi:uncharacterized membrane protein